MARTAGNETQVSRTVTNDAGAAPRSARKTLEERLNELIEQQSRLTAQKRALASQQRQENRERIEEIEGIIGAICRGDTATHEVVKAAIARSTLDPKRRALLKREGWI
jgi:hypothetical protein